MIILFCPITTHQIISSLPVVMRQGFNKPLNLNFGLLHQRKGYRLAKTSLKAKGSNGSRTEIGIIKRRIVGSGGKIGKP